MHLNTQALERITKPKHRKGSTEEHIFADNQRARTTAALVASVKRKPAAVDPDVQRSLDIIAGRVS